MFPTSCRTLLVGRNARSAAALIKSCLSSRGAAHRVDAAQESAHPLPIAADPQLRPAAAAAWKQGVAKPAMNMQRYAVSKQRRHDRNLLRRQFTGKRVLLANRGIRPAGRPIEFCDQRLAFLDPDLIHPIFVAIERQNPAVATVAQRLDCVQDGLGR